MSMICPNLKLSAGDLPEAVLLPGDPARAAAIADRLTASVRVSANREYHSFCGEFEGVPVGVVSAGVGSAGAAVAYEETIRAGARTLIRIGTAGALRPIVQAGDLVVVTGAVRAEGTSRQLVPLEMPAIADPTVSTALWEAAQAASTQVHRGVGATIDAFYPGILDLGLETYASAGAVCVEMECSVLFVIGLLRGVRTGAIVAIDADPGAVEEGRYDPHRDVVRTAVEREIDVALQAIVRLYEESHATNTPR
jgi:uridine phosphorylase